MELAGIKPGPFDLKSPALPSELPCFGNAFYLALLKIIFCSSRDEEDVEDVSLTLEEKEAAAISQISSKHNSFARREQLIPPVIFTFYFSSS